MKKVKVIMLSAVICMLLIFPSWASTSNVLKQQEVALQNDVTKAEVTKWYYRNIDGVKEKRLWSITYGYWKTEWMPV